MPAKKKTASEAANNPGATAAHAAELHLAYEKAVADYTAALEMLHNREYEKARSLFQAIEAANGDEPSLCERSRTYARVCDEHLRAAPEPPRTADDCYYRAVIQSNAGDTDGAIRLLEQALKENPASAKYLYARASAFALQGNAEAAIGDLRQAISADPQLRFQAVNDSDFELIREEPAFIDIIEPTPTGV